VKAAELALVLRAETAQMVSGLREAQNQVQGFASRVAGFARPLAVGASIVSGAFSGVHGALSAAASALSMLPGFGAAAAGGLLAIGTAAHKAVSTFASFETALANVHTMLDEQTERFLPRYRTALLDMSEEFGESAASLAGGLYQILSAGVDAGQALDVLRASAIAARAGLSDTKTAADVLTTILNAYGMTADNATRISDILFQTVKLGKTTFGELAGALSRVTSTAAAAGVPFEEVAAALAVLTRAGIKTDEAVTALNMALQAMIKPTEEAEEWAQKLGIGMSAAQLKAEGLAGFMRRLAASDIGVEAIAKLFPTVRGLKAILTLKSAAADFGQFVQKMYSSTGAAQEAFHKQTKTFAFTWSQLVQTGKRFLIEIAEPLIPVLKELAAALRPILRAAAKILQVLVKIASYALKPVVWLMQGLGWVAEKLGLVTPSSSKAAKATKELADAQAAAAKVAGLLAAASDKAAQMTDAQRQSLIKAVTAAKQQISTNAMLKREIEEIAAAWDSAGHKTEAALLRAAAGLRETATAEKTAAQAAKDAATAKEQSAEKILRAMEEQRRSGKLTAEEELRRLEALVAKEGWSTKERIALLKRLEEVREEVVDARLRRIEHLRRMERMSAEEEIEQLRRVLSEFKLAQEKRWEIEERIYELEKRLREKRLREMLAQIDFEVAMGRKSAEERIALLRRILAEEELTAEQRRRLMLRVHEEEKRLDEERKRQLQDLFRLRQDLIRHERSLGKLTQEEYIERLKDLLRVEGSTAEERRRILEEIYRAGEELLRERMRSAMKAAEAMIEDEGIRARMRIEILRMMIKQYRKGTRERLRLEQELLREEVALMRKEREERRRHIRQQETDRLKRLRENFERLRRLAGLNWAFEKRGAEMAARFKKGAARAAVVYEEELWREFRRRYMVGLREFNKERLAEAIEFARLREEQEGFTPKQRARWRRLRERLEQEFLKVHTKRLMKQGLSEKEARRAAEEELNRIRGSWQKSQEEQAEIAAKAQEKVAQAMERLRQQNLEVSEILKQKWGATIETIRKGLRALIEDGISAIEVLRRITMAATAAGLRGVPLLPRLPAPARGGVTRAEIRVGPVNIGWLDGWISARQAAEAIAEYFRDNLATWYFGSA